MELPVESLRVSLLSALEKSPVVLLAPTGTGKSTAVPLWFENRVLIIQPRRVACRAVASRLARSLGSELGGEVGYRVRDDDRSSAQSRLLVVTPGIVLHTPQLLDDFDHVIVDEFHERRLDTDLICALLDAKKAHFLMMSATLNAHRIADVYSARALEVHVRTHPVAIDYAHDGDQLPESRGLVDAVVRATESLGKLDGDVLVFLPGKAEISAVAKALGSRQVPVLELHGGLDLQKQARVLSGSDVPRIILATNVAETSLTVPGVTVVIDSGLVRRTAYHEGRSYLTLSNIAEDSADQRAGRAGRTQPGRCLRLWGKRARLTPYTPPEVHRESLVPLVLVAARLNIAVESLRFVDAPHDYALADARTRLRELGALEPAPQASSGYRMTQRGEALSSLPLDAWLSRILVEAKERGSLNQVIDLVALLDHQRAAQLAGWAPAEELVRPDCDLCACLWALDCATPPPASLRPILEEVRSTAQRLRRAFGLKGHEATRHSNRSRDEHLRLSLLETLVRADPRAVYVARERKREICWSNGGTELTLAATSRLQREFEEKRPRVAGDLPRPIALFALATRGTGRGPRDRRALIVLSSPVAPGLLAAQGVGEKKLSQVSRDSSGRLVVKVETTYAGRRLGEEELCPRGSLARKALAQLFLEGRFFPQALREARRRLARRALAAELGSRTAADIFRGYQEPPPLDSFVADRLAELGVESGEDLELLDPSDLLPDDVPAELAPALDDKFPQWVDLGDSQYRVTYDLDKHQVVLTLEKGNREKAPPAHYLPRFPGFSIYIEAGGTIVPVRR